MTQIGTSYLLTSACQFFNQSILVCIDNNSRLVTALRQALRKHVLGSRCNLSPDPTLQDLIGRKPVLFAAIGIFLIGSALCGAAQNFTWLAVCRGVQGIGGGGIMQMTMITIGDIVTLEVSRTALSDGIGADACATGTRQIHRCHRSHLGNCKRCRSVGGRSICR